MDIKKKLQADSNVKRNRVLAQHILEHPQLFDELMQYFFSEDLRIAQRSSNVVNLCVEKNNLLIFPYLPKIIKGLKKTPHDAYKRNSIRLMQFIDLPEEHIGDVADICFKYLDSVKEPIAVRAFSMTVLYNITKTYPEIKNELIMMIEDHLPYGSAGIKARGKNILRLLRKG